ncbi:YcxB family protein [Streptomyces sp. NPDC058157]|uniref:YcxB family protein n=1 Tax=Streptomyces sp. NPDC058157 TaxID=3346360 RepID=UPI0036F07606
MDDIRQATVTFSGTLTREEFDEAVAATGTFRRVRWLILAAAVLMAALGLRPLPDGGPVNGGLLTLAVVYGVLGLFLPPLLTGRAFRADQAKGEKQATIDAAGFVVVRGGVELVRVPWRSMYRVHETERVYVVTGRLGWKAGLMIVPKRLLAGAGEAELVGVLLETRVGRSKARRA